MVIAPLRRYFLATYEPSRARLDSGWLIYHTRKGSLVINRKYFMIEQVW